MKKKNTTQPAEQPQPSQPAQKPKESVIGQLIFVAALAVTILAITFGGPLYRKFGPKPTVVCVRCHHVIEKSFSGKKFVFNNHVGADSDRSELIYCLDHLPKWDYGVKYEGKIQLFYANMDVECDEYGVPLQEVVSHTNMWVTSTGGWMVVTNKNGWITLTENTNNMHTNFAVSTEFRIVGRAKHILY